MTHPSDARCNRTASYVTTTTSIAGPFELGFSYSDDDESSTTSTLTGLTGWTSVNGGGLETVYESNESEEQFPIAHSRSNKSAYTESSDDGKEIIKISPISFGMEDGGIETRLREDYEMRLQTRSYNSKGSSSNNSNASKKRAPVPPLRDPNTDDEEEDEMWEEDCNYEINPTLVFQALESQNWGEAIALMEENVLEKNNQAWNIGQFFGGGKLNEEDDANIQAQARTWVVRRERNGLLRWRMLPLHAALTFNAPFEVVFRLYQLYPGAVRCRNNQGMLPLHQVFNYGSEDRVLELLLEVFPEALTVADDKGRLPLECTPKDGSDNERRSNILTLFSNFQVCLALSTTKNELNSPEADASVSQRNYLPAKDVAAAAQQTNVRITNIVPSSPADVERAQKIPHSPMSIKDGDRYAMLSPANVEQARMVPDSPLSMKDGDRYAMLGSEDSENDPSFGNARLGLSTIPEEGHSGTLSPRKNEVAFKTALLELGERKKENILRKVLAGQNFAQNGQDAPPLTMPNQQYDCTQPQCSQKEFELNSAKQMLQAQIAINGARQKQLKDTENMLKRELGITSETPASKGCQSLQQARSLGSQKRSDGSLSEQTSHSTARSSSLSSGRNFLEVNVHSALFQGLPEDTRSFVLIDFYKYGSEHSGIVRGASPTFKFTATYEIEDDHFFSHTLAKGEFVRVEIYTLQKKTATPRLFAYTSVSTYATLHPSAAIHLPELKLIPVKDEGAVGTLSLSMRLARPISAPGSSSVISHNSSSEISHNSYSEIAPISSREIMATMRKRSGVTSCGRRVVPEAASVLIESVTLSGDHACGKSDSFYVHYNFLSFDDVLTNLNTVNSKGDITFEHKSVFPVLPTDGGSVKELSKRILHFTLFSSNESRSCGQVLGEAQVAMRDIWGHSTLSTEIISSDGMCIGSIAITFDTTVERTSIETEKN